MTKTQARAEAQTRWAARGTFGAYPQVCLRTKKYVNRCLVGCVCWTDAAHTRCSPIILGEGPTWEAAFANADAREVQGLPPLKESFL